ncbi:hypothetical protein ACVCAH_36670 [Micromonospora sp. LZ34]
MLMVFFVDEPSTGDLATSITDAPDFHRHATAEFGAGPVVQASEGRTQSK